MEVKIGSEHLVAGRISCKMGVNHWFHSPSPFIAHRVRGKH